MTMNSLIGVKNYTTENNVAKSAFEFQMLYGLRQDTCEQLVQEGYNVRVYVPYGTMWVPYFTRRLKERKENVFFLYCLPCSRNSID